MNLIPYFLFTIIFTIIIVCTKINNIYILTVIYSSISLYLIFNYYKKKDLDYKRYLYILWVLLSFMLDIFFFSITNIVVTILLFIIIMFQYYLLKKCTCNLFGHTHQHTNFYQDIPFMYHVGVDSHNCCPVLLDKAINDMNKKVEECLAKL